MIKLPFAAKIAAFTLLVGVLMALLGGSANALSGAEFKAGRIIDDEVFTNKNTMSIQDIQNFLNAKLPTCDTNGTGSTTRWSSQHNRYYTRAEWGALNGSPAPFICLKDYHENPVTKANNLNGSMPSGAKSAAHIIFDAAQTYHINPQTLIVLLQKEQSLVTDDWPFRVQYRSATGFGCPDTAPCDSTHYGFYNQVTRAAEYFRGYIRGSQGDPEWAWVPYKTGLRSILYNPNHGCGSSNVLIENASTAALYNYTPYQPNAAALANLYGTGDSCSAYGNRNFWRMFRDWFGSVTGDSYTLAISDDGTPTQYVLYGSIKQAIPDVATKVAWGLDNVPLITMPASYLASKATGPNLDRVYRVNGSSTLGFVDSGRRYILPDGALQAWNLQWRTISSVSLGLGLLPIDSGPLGFAVKKAGSSTAYMVDGADGSGQTVLRPYASSTVLAAWEGDSRRVITLSDEFFNQIDNAIGSPLTSTKISVGGNEFQVVDKMRMPQPSGYSSLFPGTAASVSTATYNRLKPYRNVSSVVRSGGGPTIYLIENGKKHMLPSPSLVSAWTPAGNSVMLVNDGYIHAIPDGPQIDVYMATSDNSTYIINQKRTPVPEVLEDAYGNASETIAISSALLSLYPVSGVNLTPFIKGFTSPNIYMLDNSGNRIHMDTGEKMTDWGGWKTGIIGMPDAIVNSYKLGPGAPTLVSDGTNEYLIGDGKKYPLSGSIKANWGFGAAHIFSDETLDRLPEGPPIVNEFRDGGTYFLVRGGAGFVTTDPNIAQVWGIQNAPPLPQRLLTASRRIYPLTRFVTSLDKQLFVVDRGNWYAVSAAQLANLGGVGAPAITLSPSYAPNTITDWTSVVVINAARTAFVIDGGGKRYMPHWMIYNQWTNNGDLTAPLMSDGFLNLLPTRGLIERTIKGSGPSIYSAQNGTKRHILYSQTYHTYHAPYIIVTDALLNAMPTGPSL